SGYASADIAEVRVGDQVATAAEGRFALSVPLIEGAQEFTVQGLDAEGAVVTTQRLPVTYDSVAPELTITDMPVDEQGAAILDEDGAVTITGTVTDSRKDAQLGVSAGDAEAEVGQDGGFTLTVTPDARAAGFTLTATDGANTTALPVAIAGRAPAPSWAMPVITNADCVLDSGACF